MNTEEHEAETGFAPTDYDPGLAWSQEVETDDLAYLYTGHNTRSRLTVVALVALMIGAVLAAAWFATELYGGGSSSSSSQGTTTAVPTTMPETEAITPVIPDVPDAQAPNLDSRYVAILANNGVTGAHLVRDAHIICDELASGRENAAYFVNDLVQNGSNIQPWQARMVVTTAISTYCPKA